MNKVINLMIKETQGDFKVFYDTEYVDDGNILIDIKYIDRFLKLINDAYKEANIKINYGKSKLIARTKNNIVIEELLKLHQKYGIDYSIKGEYKYLGVPYGNDFINSTMNEKINKLWIKLRYILALKSNFIKFNLLQKFFNYNKIIYLLKCVEKVGNWMDNLQKLYNVIRNEIKMGLQWNNTMKYQIPLSQRRGGFGLRSPLNYQYAAEITMLRGKMDMLFKCFPFCLSSYNMENVRKQEFEIKEEDDIDIIMNNGNVESKQNEDANEIKYQEYNWFNVRNANELEMYRQEAIKKMEIYGHRLQYNIDELNQLLAPKYIYDMNIHNKHNKIIELMDKNNLDKINEIGNENDKARLLTLSCNGAMAWLNVPWNMYWSTQYDNKKFFTLIALILGAKLRDNKYICKACKEEVDEYGHHALHCKGIKNDNLIKRHDVLCDELARWFKRAGFNPIMEARYHNGKRLMERPGDIKIENLVIEDNDPMDIYLDITVGNIFAGSYIKMAQKRMGLAKELELKKSQKYGNRADIMGLGYESLGAMSKNFKIIIRTIADRLEFKTNVIANIWIHRIRAQLNAKLMKFNAKMILESGIHEFEYQNHDDENLHDIMEDL